MSMYRSTILAAAMAVVAFGVVGCSSLSTTQSGFLKDYSELQPVDGERGSRAYKDEAFDWASVESIALQPVSLALPDDRRERFSEEELNLVLAEADAILREVMGKRLRIVEGAERAQVGLRIAITDIDEVRVGVNAITSIVAVPVDNGGVSVELEIFDTASARRVYAFAGYKVGKVVQVKGYFSRLGNVKSGLRSIAESTVSAIKGNP